MRHSIFIRIFVSCLLPLIIIFSLIIVTINGIVYDQIVASADEKSRSFAAETTRQITDIHINVQGLLDLLRSNLVQIDPSIPNSDEVVKDLLKSMLKTTPYIHCAWFVFEQGEFYEDDTFDTDFVKDLKGNIVEIPNLGDDEMADPDPEVGKWYKVPLLEGKVYFLIADYFDYGLGYGEKYTDTISAPMIRGDETIGVIGIDTLYDDTFRFLEEKQVENEQLVLLVTGEGEIVYAPDESYLTESIFDMLGIPAVQADEPVHIDAVSPFFGVRSSMYFSPVYTDSEGNRMYLYLDLPSNVLFARAANTTRTIILLCAAGMVLLGAVLLLIVRNILKPVKKLTESANMLASGILDVDFASEFTETGEEAGSKNEIVILSVALRKMLDRLVQAQAFAAEIDMLDRLNSMKTVFLQNMSHDLKTPLTVISTDILNSADQLDFEIDKEDMRESLANAQQEIMRMARMIDGAMKHSFMQDDRHDMKPMDIAPTLREGAATYRALLERHGNAMILDVPDALPPIYGNADMILHVLSNLLSNANRYTRNGKISISASAENGTVSVTVQDSGEGVKPELLPRVFERGVSENGTGLGLFICKTTIEAHNGAIYAESEWGKGTGITFVLPIYDEGATGQ